MKSTHPSRLALPGSLPTLLFIALSNGSAQACAACYGDTSGSRMGNAAAIGIIAMCIIMFAMLGAVAGFGFYLNYREKNPLPDYSELLAEDEAKPNPGTSI